MAPALWHVEWRVLTLCAPQMRSVAVRFSFPPVIDPFTDQIEASLLAEEGSAADLMKLSDGQWALPVKGFCMVLSLLVRCRNLAPHRTLKPPLPSCEAACRAAHSEPRTLHRGARRRNDGGGHARARPQWRCGGRLLLLVSC